MNEKRRYLTHIEPSTYNYVVAGEVIPGPAIAASGIVSLQTTQSRGHAWNNSRKPDTDIGGDFSTARVQSMSWSDNSTHVGTKFGYYYDGREFAVNPAGGASYALSLVEQSSDASLMLLGTKAIARCIPTNPIVDGATFLGELKSGLPKLVGKELFKSKFKDYRKVGSEYINIEFGWKPIISDLQSAAKSVTESEKILKQLQRDSGRNIRRKFTFPVEVVSTRVEGPISYSKGEGGRNLYPGCYYGGAKVVTTTEVETKTWFSGCFTYHLDLGKTLNSRISRQAAEARKLYGLELTPETVWNLAPWSWAVDWEGSMGDVLHNVSRFAQDGLVMRYGYVMQQKTAKVTYTLPWAGRLNRAPKESLTLTVTSQSKVRRRATPFGFGFDMKALNSRQSSILGALAIARGPRHL
jgi:hypothetical protein